TDKQIVSNMVNKGADFLALVERKETEAIAGHLLGRDFLLSSLTGHLFKGPTHEAQLIHRDQGQVPASAPFPALVNLFYLLDDFTPERGSTLVVPGSHRWAPEHLIKPPPLEMAVQVSAPAGSLFAFEGRLWHGAGINQTGHARRSISVFCSAPWLRQQENGGATYLQDVLDNASDTLKVRLGLKTYGTLGQMNGAIAAEEKVSFGSYEVRVPDYIIGEEGALHPLRRVRRGDTQ
ncbi:MAG: phytanoyl-CoA dioxygenase family protein, partial [Alphaproteobacteria bacterium]